MCARTFGPVERLIADEAHIAYEGFTLRTARDRDVHTGVDLVRVWSDRTPCVRPYGRTEDGRQLKIMPVVVKYTRECLTIVVCRSITAHDVI